MIDNTQDMIDSRDIEARIEELQDSIEEAKAGDGKGFTTHDLENMQTELSHLVAFKEDIGDSCFRNQEALVRESYFTDHIRELINDCYEMPKEMDSCAWPWRHMTVDYEAAAEDAKSDYETAEYDGVTYYYRSC